MNKFTVVVEEKYRYQPAIPILNGLADACRFLGMEVIQWNDKSPFPSDCNPNLLIIWNKFDRGGKEDCISKWNAKVPTIYVESGWLLQPTSFQMDLNGINGYASWSKDFQYIPKGKINYLQAKDKNLPLLVILQADGDSNLNKDALSPHFTVNKEFLEFLSDTVKEPMIVRGHPLYPPKRGADDIIRNNPYMEYDKSPNLATALRNKKAVFMINSTSGVEAVYHGLPVFMYGNNVYRHDGVVYCCDVNKETTLKYLNEVNTGITSLDRDKQMAFIRLIFEKQWYLGQLPYRLGEFLHTNNIYRI